MKYAVVMILSVMLVGCGEDYDGPIHPIHGTWINQNKSCSGPVGSEVCSAGPLPNACQGITLYDSVYFDKTADAVGLNGDNVPVHVNRNSDGLTFGTVSARLYSGGAIFTYTDGCEIEYQR